MQLEGRFLQHRTLRYQQCQAGHPHTAATLRVLAELNCQLRFVKFWWEPGDGKITFWGDIGLVDAGLTQAQFSRVLSNYLPAIDDQYPHAAMTIATGRDPGPINASPPDIEKLLGARATPDPAPGSRTRGALRCYELLDAIEACGTHGEITVGFPQEFLS
jgi:hypothetical protein